MEDESDMSNMLLLFSDIPFSFGPKFLQDHAGHIITDPRIALVELIANSYDAGASHVTVQWPEAAGDTFQVEDNGTALSFKIFRLIGGLSWPPLL
jgi:hypothetical protein